MICAIINGEVEKTGCKVEKIISFGSWVRGDYRENSGYGFFSMKSFNVATIKKTRKTPYLLLNFEKIYPILFRGV
ncbi:hypothetical protein ACMCNP_08220 [Candidatus Acidulodesulfobacterium sp. H_13]|uniref:hypothetical protein n=1 Tax=Candidatus Acidulodesulfobacterium sp. H_13 TaxID=3395470 RepID=UPI003AF66C26